MKKAALLTSTSKMKWWGSVNAITKKSSFVYILAPCRAEHIIGYISIMASSQDMNINTNRHISNLVIFIDAN